MYDLVIVGAGPAGATLARLIGSRYRVLLLERRRLDIPYRQGMQGKCCGGLLAPDAQHMLARMGLGLPGEVLVGPQLFTVRTMDGQSGRERYYQRHYINMDREKFDRFLLSLVPPAVEIRCGCEVRDVVLEEGMQQVRFCWRGKDYREQARLVVGADGAASFCARSLGGPRPRTYAAIQESYEARENLPYFSVLFDSGITDFYCWTIPKGDSLLVGAAVLPGKGAGKAFERFRALMERYGMISGKKISRSGSLLLRPLTARQISFGRDGMALIGEAGGFISPTSAEGLSYAMKSACLLARSLQSLDPLVLSRYRASGISLRRNILLKLIKMPFMYSGPLRRLVMSSGFRAMKLFEA